MYPLQDALAESPFALLAESPFNGPLARISEAASPLALLAASLSALLAASPLAELSVSP